MTLTSAFAPFRVRGYRFQWSADLLVSWAFEMETLILGWYVLVETGSVLYLTLYGALLYVGTLIAPMLGVASDRLGHRNLLSGMRAIYACVAAALLMLALAGALNPLLVLIIAAISGLVRPSDMGLRGAVIAEIMPANMLTGAMSFARTTTDIARIVGALSGAGMFAAFGMAPAYVVITTLYTLGSLLTWFAVPKHAEASAIVASSVPVQRASTWSDLREGIVYVWNTPVLLAVVCLTVLFNFAAFPLTNGLLPYIAKSVYQSDQTGLGYMVAAIGIGALIGAMIMTWFSAEIRLTRVLLVSACIWHIMILVFIQMDTLVGGVVLLLVCGLLQSLTMVSHTVLLLRGASARFRGRVLGVRMLAIYTLPLGLLIAGALVERIGFRWAASLFATIGLVFTIVIGVKWRAHFWHAPAADSSLQQQR